jgi:hypothetical protein
VKTSKFPGRVLQVADEAACRALPVHAHRSSPKKFTQPNSWPDWCSRSSRASTNVGWLSTSPTIPTTAGRSKAVPYFTTFQKAAHRLLAAVPGRRIFDAML